MRTLRQNPLLAVVVAVASAPALGAPSFQIIDGWNRFPSYRSLNISADGSTVVGYNRVGSAASRYALSIWSEAQGRIDLPLSTTSDNHAPDYYVAPGISGDGSIVAFADASNLYRWTRDGGPQLLACLDDTGNGFRSTATSADGSIIYASTSTRLYRWTATGGLVDLGAPQSEYTQVSVHDVSADGRIVVGRLQDKRLFSRPFLWSDDRGYVELTGGLPDGNGIANAISSDGRRIVGTVVFDYDYFSAQWSVDDLVPVVDASLTNWSDTSADMSVLIGNKLQQSIDEAYVWNAVDGPTKLIDVIRSLGFDVSGMIFRDVAAISDDGLTIVGNVNHPFVLHLPEPSTALVLIATPLLLPRRGR